MKCPECLGKGYISDTKLRKIIKLLTLNNDLERCPRCGGTGQI